jgi:hypothetical protein
VDHALGRSHIIVSNSSEFVFKQLINEIDYDSNTTNPTKNQMALKIGNINHPAKNQIILQRTNTIMMARISKIGFFMEISIAI